MEQKPVLSKNHLSIFSREKTRNEPQSLPHIQQYFFYFTLTPNLFMSYVTFL